MSSTPPGGYLNPWRDERLHLFFHHFPKPDHVLELSCLFGDHTIELARKAKRVTVIDGRSDNIAVAKRRCAEAGLTNVEFIEANLEEEVPSIDASVIFCSGILYHLPKPWEFLTRLTAPHLFLWTHISVDITPTIMDEYEGEWYTEGGRLNPHSGLSPKSFWLTKPSLFKALEKADYAVLQEYTDMRTPQPSRILVCEKLPEEEQCSPS